MSATHAGALPSVSVSVSIALAGDRDTRSGRVLTDSGDNRGGFESTHFGHMPGRQPIMVSLRLFALAPLGAFLQAHDAVNALALRRHSAGLLVSTPPIRHRNSDTACS